ncbi:MAG: nucleoside monophosphate kinase [Candidatus Paceibacterota bacterium]|jgi:adenylate kinase family enzyme
MKKITLVFFGRSGSGKGTQAGLLMEYMKKHDPERKIIYIETGERFRRFINSDNFTAKKVKEILAAGKLLPAFLPIWIWTGLMVDEAKGDEHMVFDGVSRRPEEAPILDTALQFYAADGEKPYILFLDTHHEEARTRLIKRGRYDDKHEKIDERFRWFETDVMPAIKYFEAQKHCHFVKINGDQTIENVFKDIRKALGI